MITDNEVLYLSSILYSKSYLDKVLPHLRSEYFVDSANRDLFVEIARFAADYSKVPTPTALAIELQKKDIPDDHLEEIGRVLGLIASHGEDAATSKNEEWLVSETEKWCKERAIQIAVLESFEVISGKNTQIQPDALPHLLQEALKVSFDNRIGHDYFLDCDERFRSYVEKEARIEFDIEILNKITKGGLADKTLTIIVGGTGGGKSLTKCHMAANNLSSGKNVLYITMEMSEEKIAERIDANLLNIDIGNIDKLDASEFTSRVQKVASKTQGRLIVKEFPTAGAHVGHFRALLNDLKLKKDFVPDIIYIDYLNICASSRVKGGDNSYGLVKSIAEEVRGLAIEYSVPIVSSTQINRAGFSNSDPDLDNISDSFGIAYTADLALLIMGNEQLDSLGQVLFKQLKNRYNDLNYYKRFVVGIDKPKMKLFDAEEVAQDLVEMQQESQEDIPAFDLSKSGSRLNSENKFGGFNV